MLVLTRQPGERISIGPEITLEVVMVEGGQARLAITAPRHLNIARTELLGRQRTDRSSDDGLVDG